MCVHGLLTSIYGAEPEHPLGGVWLVEVGVEGMWKGCGRQSQSSEALLHPPRHSTLPSVPAVVLKGQTPLGNISIIEKFPRNTIAKLLSRPTESQNSGHEA